MSSGSQCDFDEAPSSADQNNTLGPAASTNQVGVALPAPPPQADPPPVFRSLEVRRSRTGTMFAIHTCQRNLETLRSVNPDPIGSVLHRPHETALVLYLACSTSNNEESLQRSLHLLLSCGACMSELCLIAAKMSNETTEYVLGKVHRPPKLSNLASTSLFETVLSRATKVDLPWLYGNMGFPAELPCVKLSLCGCFMRPLYAAIYFSNAQMLSTLLRYGAEVRPEDMCRCEDPLSMHQLVRVYRKLIGLCRNPPGPVYGLRNIPASVNAVRCHQLAALVIPRGDMELREACFTLVKTFAPSAEYETLLREKQSLRHFCRLTIRAALARRQAMPREVEQLPLPKPLKRYILYQHGRGCV